MEDFNSKYTGQQVEDLLDQVASGNAGGGGGGITVETDPIFSASPAATITEQKIAEWDNKYNKPNGGIPERDLASDVQTSLGKADNSLQVEKFQGMDIVTVNGIAGGNSGLVYALPHESIGEEDDVLLSRYTVKTINGESILGSGDITIAGGSGEKGDKGDKGDTGVGVQSVAQTTTSNADGGSNVVTVTLTDGAKSTFTVKNGSKGSQGVQGEQGPKGDKGDKGDTGATGANGTNGVSVSSVKQTTTSSADGGTNVVTVTLSNGTTSTFNVKNGSKGSSGSNGTNGKDGADGADGATFTPSVDSAGNLSWTNNKGLTNPPTVNIKGPKGDKGDAGEGGGGSGGGGKEYVKVKVLDGSIVFLGNESRPSFEPNKIYYAAEPIEDSVSIFSVTPPTGDVGEYTLYFDTMVTSSIFIGTLELPSEWVWANGEIPTLEKGVAYELSVVATKSGNEFIYKAVLTPFEAV